MIASEVSRDSERCFKIFKGFDDMDSAFGEFNLELNNDESESLQVAKRVSAENRA